MKKNSSTAGNGHKIRKIKTAVERVLPLVLKKERHAKKSVTSGRLERSEGKETTRSI